MTLRTKQAAPSSIRPALPADCAAVAAIYNDGIDDRVDTFETEHRSARQIEAWLGERGPFLVAEHTEGAHQIMAFARVSAYRSRACYDGIGEFSVYVARPARGKGFGHAVMTGLIQAAQHAGYWKLLSRIFPENTASLALCDRLGFRRVGTYQRHGQLDGHWRDTVIVEKRLE
ncbi:MAG: arsinothricin resistance N-acetyltransferase ArsN1 family A [Pseudomonadota bacterium]